MEEVELKILIYVVSIILLLLGVFILLFFLAYKSKQQNHINRIAQLKEAHLKSQIEIQEQLFKNISQEIHDNIGQTLSLAKLNLNTLEKIDHPTTSDKLENSKELISKAINELRSLAKILNKDTILAVGLEETIKQELDRISRAGNYGVQFSVDGVRYPLSPQKELILFRIIQEGLNNIIKHAQASSIEVKFTYDNVGLTLQLTDNGIGMDPDQTPSLRGSGIINMRNRAEIIGGDLMIDSIAGKGSTLIIKLSKGNA